MSEQREEEPSALWLFWRWLRCLVFKATGRLAVDEPRLASEGRVTENLPYRRPLGSEGITKALFLRSKKWRIRTVVKLAILDKTEVRWHISVNFMVPSPSGLPFTSTPFPLYVPMVAMPKRKFGGIDACDESNQSLTLMTRTLGRQLSHRFLVYLWRRTFRCVNADTEQHLRDLIESTSAEGLETVKHLQQGYLYSHLPDKKRTNLTHLLRLFATSDVLYVLLPDARYSERRIITVDLRDRLPLTDDDDPRDGQHLYLFFRACRKVLRVIGIRSTPIIWRNAVGDTGSYHLQMDAPDGLVFSDALLTDNSGRSLRKWSGRFNVKRLDTGEPNTTYVHLYDESRRDKSPHLIHGLYFRASPTGWLAPSAVTSGLFAIAITYIAATIETLHLNQGGTQATAAALLAAGAVAGLFLARSQEHTYTSRLLRAVRFALGGTVVALFIVIAMLFLVRVNCSVVHRDDLCIVTKRIGPFAWLRWVCVGIVWPAFLITIGNLFSTWVAGRRFKYHQKRDKKRPDNEKLFPKRSYGPT